MASSARATASMAAGAAAVFVRSGILRPLPPRTARSVAGARRRLGESTALLAAIGAARWPDRVAISDERGTVTYADLHRRVAALAAGLKRDLGAGPDRSIAVLCRNHAGLMETAMAAGRLGADLILLNTDFAGPQLADVIAREQPGLIVLDEEFLPALGFAGAGAPPAVIAWRDGDGPSTLPTLEALASEPLREPPPLPTRTSRLTILTSGTTGTPKGARRGPGGPALAGVVASMVHRTGLRSGDPILVSVPMFHGYGFALAMLTLMLGSPLTLRRRFDPQDVLAVIAEERIAMATVVPVMLKRLLDAPGEHDRSSLRIVLSGAAPLDPVLAERTLKAWGDVLFNGYGSSEVGIATFAMPADLHANPSSVGRAVMGTTVRVFDDEHRTVPPGVTGHIFVGGGMTFDGYTGGGGRGPKAAIEGLVSTGDMGHMDPLGRLAIDGREDDMIVSGGENVYPQEIEDVLHAHDAVADVAVLGVHDDEFGQRLAAYVVREDGEALDEDDVRQFVRERLARYKVPRDVIFVDELPRTSTGKVRRRSLPGAG